MIKFTNKTDNLIGTVRKLVGPNEAPSSYVLGDRNRMSDFPNYLIKIYVLYMFYDCCEKNVKFMFCDSSDIFYVEHL